MKKSIFIFIGIVMAGFSFGQNEQDALRYSFLNYQGTARFAGLGGAMGALGADMSSINLNPAGIGRYSRNDFSLTGNVTYSGAESIYNNSFNTGNKANFNFSNIGAVFVKPIDFNKASMWRFFQFGVSSSRTNDFHGRSFTEGQGDYSMIHSYTDFLNRNNVPLSQISDFYEGQAFDAGLLFYDSINNNYFPWHDTAAGNITQTNNVTTRGAQYQTDITFGGNYDGKLYVGGSIGFPRIRYESQRVFTEVFNSPDSILDTQNYTFEENLRTEGSGFNMKIGAIYTPNQYLRLGLAVHTPTWYSMEDAFSTEFVSNFIDDNFNARANSPPGVFEYRLRTPGRMIASAAFLYKKRGFLSLEYELVDYSNATLNNAVGNLSPGDFSAQNAVSQDIYQSAGIIKVGAEFRATNHWTVRGGYNYFGSPIKEEVSLVDNSRTNISAGVGYKTREFSLDFTFVRSQWQEESYLFDPSFANPVITDRYINNFMLTAGFRF